MVSTYVYAQETKNQQCDGSRTDPDCAEVCSKDPNASGCRQYKMGKLWELANVLDQILSFLYLIMRPLLYVAGLAMDNSLIYGEWLGLTWLLYQFWTIMRSLANFVIVFLLVWTIGKQMRDWAKWAKELGKTIMAIMVSGIVINASWFLIWAMVDLSTIATYGVWTIPLKLSWGSEWYCDKDGKVIGEIGKVDNTPKATAQQKWMNDIAKLWNCRPILATHGTMNLSDTFNAEAAQWKVYYSYEAKQVNPWTHYFLSCPFKNGSLTTSWWNTFLNSFTLSGTYALANGATGMIAWDQKVKDYLRKPDSIGSKYCVVWTNQIMEVPKNGKTDLYGSWYYNAVIWWVNTLHSWWWLRIRNLVETNKGMIGVMYTMYGNMLWFANIKTDVQTNSTESQIIQFLVKWFFGFAIMFPLIALCVVLMMRVAVLWMVVWFSPLLVLWWTLELMGIKNEQLSSMMKWIWEKLTLSNVVNLLFQPVLVVFVITMGMMFLDALQATIVADNGFWEALKCSNDSVSWQQCCSMIDVVNICFEKFNAQAGTDAFFNYFTFTIVNIVGVMLLWFMVFAVMKSSKITEWAVSKIQWLGRNILWSIPVIPWFDGTPVWFDGAKEGLGKAFDTVTEGTKDKTGDTITKPWVDKTFEDLSGAAGTAKKSMTKWFSDIKPKDIEDWSKTKEFREEFLKSIDTAKADVKYSTAGDLVDVSDPRVDALFNKYKISDKKLENLLTNPEFMSDTGKDSKSGREIFKTKWWDKTKYVDLWKGKYLEALKNQASKIESIWSRNRWYHKTSDGSKMLVEKIVKKSDSWAITDIEIKPLGISIKDTPLLWKYSYDDVKDLSGKLTENELKGFTGLSRWIIEKETKVKEWREIVEGATNKELMDIKQRSKLPA